MGRPALLPLILHLLPRFDNHFFYVILYLIDRLIHVRGNLLYPEHAPRYLDIYLSPENVALIMSGGPSDLEVAIYHRQIAEKAIKHIRLLLDIAADSVSQLETGGFDVYLHMIYYPALAREAELIIKVAEVIIARLEKLDDILISHEYY